MVRSTKAREKAKELLRKKLKVEEVLVLGICREEVRRRGRRRGGRSRGRGSGGGGARETTFSFFLEKGVEKNNNEEGQEERREKKRNSLIWEKYGEDGVLIKVGGELDLTTKFQIFTDCSDFPRNRLSRKKFDKHWRKENFFSAKEKCKEK